MNPVSHFFSHAGTINRRTYVASMMGLFWTVTAISAALPPAILLFFPMLYAMACLTVKRLHDIGLSGKWALLPLVAIVLYIGALLLSGVIAFGAGLGNAGAQAESWANAVGGWLAFCILLAWIALVFMPGNSHTRRKFGRTPIPLVQPPLPDLAGAKVRMRRAASDAVNAAGQAARSSAMILRSLVGVNYLRLYFAASGRISRGAYIAASAAALFFGLLLIVRLEMVSQIGWLAVILLFYCTTCLASKRLHDFGASGWLAGVPFVVVYAYLVLEFGLVLINWGLFGAEVRSHPMIHALDRSTDETAGYLLLASLMAYAVIGLVPGQRGPNVHGEPPISRDAADAPDALAA